MGVWILYDAEVQRAVYYDSTDEQALGVVSFQGADAEEQAGSFLAYLCTKHNREACATVPRHSDNPFAYPGIDLDRAYGRWYALVGLSEGRMNDYGWTLHEWQQMRPTYQQVGDRDALYAAPEPEEVQA